jgi:hypothetical protein
MELCQTRKSPYRLTPDLRLTRRFGEGDGVTNAEKTLSEIEHLVR